MTVKRAKPAWEGTLMKGVRKRVDDRREPDQSDLVGDEGETPQAISLPGTQRDMFLLRHPDSYTDPDKLRDAVPPPPGYCYTLDGRLVPLLEVRLPLEDVTAQTIFCEVLEVTGSMRAACDTLGIRSERIVLNYMTTDPEFAESVSIAAERHRQRLYSVALQRATTGFQKPILGGKDKDQIVAYETVYSDSLLVLLLKRHFPEFRDASRSGATINLTNTTNTMNVSTFNPKKMSREKRDLMLKLMEDDVPEGDVSSTIEVTAIEVKDSGEN